ncbi:MAG: DUF2383 domain-containing protein [Clostridium perfringens]|nr:DUF2383 domain-containing protein [Clostridium perfringens]
MIEDKNESAIEKLNSFLNGIYMSLDSFKAYEEKAQNPNLKHSFKEILPIFESQKKLLISYIKELGGEPKDSLGLGAEIASAFEKMKEAFMARDYELLDSAIKGMDMGIKSGLKVISELEEMDIKESIVNGLKDLIKEYKTIHSSLNLLYKEPSIHD